MLEIPTLQLGAPAHPRQSRISTPAVRAVGVAGLGEGRPKAEEVGQRKLMLVLAMGCPGGMMFLRWQWVRHHRAGSPHKAQRECRSENGPPCDVTSNPDVLSRQAANSPFQQVVPLKADRQFRQWSVCSPARQSQNRGRQHQRLATSGVVVRQNLRFVAHVISQPAQRWNPEERARQQAKQENSQRVAPLQMRALVSDHRAKLAFSKPLRQFLSQVYAR